MQHFGGQTRCIMRDVEMAILHAARPPPYWFQPAMQTADHEKTRELVVTVEGDWHQYFTRLLSLDSLHIFVCAVFQILRKKSATPSQLVEYSLVSRVSGLTAMTLKEKVGILQLLIKTNFTREKPFKCSADNLWGNPFLSRNQTAHKL